MNLRIIFLLLFGITTLVTGAARSQDAWVADTGVASLYTLLGKVGLHPMVVAEAADREAARHKIAMTSTLMDPMLMVGVLNLPTNFGFSQDPMTTKMIGISQAFPFPGKLSAESAIAAQDTVTAGTKVNEQENSLARDIKLAYFELYHLERGVATNQFHVRTIDRLLEVARAKLGTGNESQSAVLDLELERTDIETQIIEEQTMLAMKRAELQRASGMDAGALAMPATLALPQLLYTLPALDSIADARRALLAGFRAEAERQALQSDRTDLDKYPDFQVSLQYMQRDALAARSDMNPTNSPAAQQLGIIPTSMAQSNMLSATLSIDLPLNYGNKRGEARSAWDAMRTSKLAEEQAAKLDIHSDLAAALAKLEGIRKEYALLRESVYPIVKQSLALSNANYVYGKASVEQVLRDQLNLLHREHDRYRLEAEYNETLATIEYLTGASLVTYSSAEVWE